MTVKSDQTTWGRAEKSVSSATLSIGLLAFTMFVIVTTEFVVVGLLPAMAKDLDLSLAEAGWFVTWFALAAALLGPPMTMVAGRCDPRRFLITAAIAFSIGNSVIALAPHYFIVITIRLLQGGVLPAIASVAAVAAARLAGAEREGWAISRVNMGVVAATVLGIPAGAMAADMAGWPASFAALALLGLISAGLILLWFPRVEIAKQTSMLIEVSLLWQPGFLVHLLLSCILFAGMFAGYTYIAALLSTLAGLDQVTIGWILMGFGLAGAFGNWIAGRVVDRDPLVATTWVAGALAFAMAVVTPAAINLSILLIFIVGLWGIAHMAAFVVTQVRVMKAGREAAAFALSLNISVCNLGIGLGAILGGRIVDLHGVGAVGYMGAAAAVVAVLIAVAMTVVRSRACSART